MMLTISPSGAEILVNDVVGGVQAIGDNASSVAVSETAGTLAVFSGTGAGRRESIFLRRFDSAGTAQDVVQASTTIRGSRSGAEVAANQAGAAVVVWQGRGPSDKFGVFFQRFDANGEKVGDETLVNETVAGEQQNPAVAMAADGSFVVAWSGPSAEDSLGVYARRFNADGSAASGEALINTTTTNYQTEPAIGMNSGGDYVITWSSLDQDSDDWGVFGQRFNAAGERQGDEFQLNTTTAASQRESSVALQDDGTFMAVWSSFAQDGDSWTVVGQRFDASGSTVGDEIVVNSSTAGAQRYPQIAGAGGKYLVTWQSGAPGGSGWEVMAREVSATGTLGAEMTVNSLSVGAGSGHQQHPSVALNAAGTGAIAWSGHGTLDRQGVYSRGFSDDDPGEVNLTPDLAVIPNQTVDPNEELVVVVTATDPNEDDTLTFQLDPTVTPAGATITRNVDDPRSATIRWTPTDAEIGTTFKFRVTVTDNGDGPLADAEEFDVEVTDGRLRLDLNGPGQEGADTTSTFPIGLGPMPIADPELSISNAANDMVSRVTAFLAETPNGSQEVLAVDTLDTNITATYTPALRRLFLSGVDTAENYERVLRTLTYNNSAEDPTGPRTVTLQVNDATLLSNRATITIDFLASEDLVAFAQALANSETQFFGASWCPACTEQKELFGDGSQFLPFVEVTNPDRTRNEVGDANNIDVYPTWIFSDDTRLEGVQSLDTIAARSGIDIPRSVDPFIAPIADGTLLVGSPSLISLDGYDPNGGTLTYSVSTNNSAIQAEILSGNRSARIDVAGYGDLVFELLEGQVSGPTQRFIELADDNFYDGLSFHRVINDFVIQGGDPNGDGTGGSTLGDFDDQFSEHYQHNRSGLLSFAKSFEDTNDSQFFITEGASTSLRNLDFHHSIFGVLVEGEANRAAISDTAVTGPANSPRPVFDVIMEDVEIFEDNENAVLLIKVIDPTADPATVGDVEVTVTVTDQQGNSFERQFTLNVEADPVNNRPFIQNFTAPTTVAAGGSAQIQLTAFDVENDTIFYRVEEPSGNAVPYTASVDENGLVTIDLTDDTTGELQINVMVAASEAAFNPLPTDLPTSRDGRIDRQLITIQVT